MVSNAMKWTPNESPTNKEINNNQRFPLGVCMSSSQRKPSQNNSAINNDAIAYTSASTALDQKLSEKANAREPTNEPPNMTIALFLSISVYWEMIFRSSMVEDQNINKMVNALENTDNMFTIKATVSLLVANIAKKAPRIWNNGAPGGWPTCSLADVEIYSPQSQKLIVGSTVSEKVIRAIVNADHPKIVFHLLKLKFII